MIDIKTIEAELDTQYYAFDRNGLTKESYDSLKSFYRTKLLSLLEDLEKHLPAEKETNFSSNLNHTELNHNAGHNSYRSQVLSLLQEYKSLIK